MNFLFQSRDPAVQAAILAQLNAKYGSGVLPDAPKEMSKASIVPEVLEPGCRLGPQQATLPFIDLMLAQAGWGKCSSSFLHLFKLLLKFI